ncbi:hypothetical protein GOV08_00520 [Candidatus Woesearchaeota archaeon]|nr:hypothetical protein [Candidatus Woesearchaeota archaeon]
MGSQILRVTLVLLSVFVPVFLARLIFYSNWNKWFYKKERSIIPLGIPVKIEGILISIVLIGIVITLLILISKLL